MRKDLLNEIRKKRMIDKERMCGIEEENSDYEQVIKTFKNNLERPKSQITFKNVHKTTVAANSSNIQGSKSCSIQ